MKLLVIDDDDLIHASLRLKLSELSIDVESAFSGDEGIKIVQSSKEKYPLILLDYHIPGTDIVATAKKIRQVSPNSVLLLFSGDHSKQTLKGAIRAGVDDFIEKSMEMNELVESIKHHWEQNVKNSQDSNVSSLPTEMDAISDLFRKNGLIGNSPRMREVGKKILNYREHPYTVLLIGESGTGKEMIARALHKGPYNQFFAVNCASYIDNVQLLESELFGYEKGAFTGAHQTKHGMLEIAAGGTVLLDEIHELSLSAQAKLLRFLQEKKIRRVGGNKEIAVKVRVIAAAKPIIFQRKESGEFLVDLFNRLYVFPIEVPPLRERKEDIKSLVQFFSEAYCAELGKKVQFSGSTLNQMQEFGWPGNVRELENTVLRLVVSAESIVSPTDFLADRDEKISDKIESLSDLKRKFENLEKNYILKALSKRKFSVRQAAKELGISHTTLFGKLKKHGISLDLTN